MSTPPAVTVSAPTPTERSRIGLLYHLGRIQFPSLTIAESAYRNHIDRAMNTFAAKSSEFVGWNEFLNTLYAFDWTVCCGCLEGLDRAWE